MRYEMDKEKELEKIANDIWALEEKCDNDISKNLPKMYQIMSGLSKEDLISVFLLLEEKSGSLK
jgi:hypothetical protein